MSSDPDCKEPFLDIFYSSQIVTIHHITYQHNNHQQILTYKRIRYCLLILSTFSTILNVTMIKLNSISLLAYNFESVNKLLSPLIPVTCMPSTTMVLSVFSPYNVLRFKVIFMPWTPSSLTNLIKELDCNCPTLCKLLSYLYHPHVSPSLELTVHILLL